MIREKDIQVGNRITGLRNDCVLEISRIYKNDNGQDYVMLIDINNMRGYEISKQHLMHMEVYLYQQEMKGWDI